MVIRIIKKNLLVKTPQKREVDLSGCTSDESVFLAFAETLEFPEWFSNNWNSFHDCIQNLCFDVNGTLYIILRNCDVLIQNEVLHFEWLLDECYEMACGNATQDDGTSIDVVFELTFDETARTEEALKKITDRLPSVLSVCIDG